MVFFGVKFSIVLMYNLTNGEKLPPALTCVHIMCIYGKFNLCVYYYIYRECIMPDVCRTFHFSAGSHISSWGQRRYFNAHSFNKLSYTMPINTTMLVVMQNKFVILDTYEDAPACTSSGHVD